METKTECLTTSRVIKMENKIDYTQKRVEEDRFKFNLNEDYEFRFENFGEERLQSEMEVLQKRIEEFKNRHTKLVEELTSQFERLFVTFIDNYNKAVDCRNKQFRHHLKENEEQERINCETRRSLGNMQKKIGDLWKIITAKVSKRKTDPKGSKKKPNKDAVSPRKAKDSKRKSAHIPELVVEEKEKEKKNRNTRASIAFPNEVQFGDKPKNESDAEFGKWQEDYNKKVIAKREENEKKSSKKHKDNGNKSPRVKKDPESKNVKKVEEKEIEKNLKQDLGESDSGKKAEIQDTSLEGILSSLDKDKEIVVPEFLSKLRELLNEPAFVIDFIRSQGFEKLSMLLVKITDTESLVLILSFLEKTFRDCSGVFEHLFADSAVMVTTLVWLLVKVKRSDLVVTARVYELLSNLPSIAYEKNFPEIEIHNLIFSAMNLYYQKAEEKLRFQNLIKALQTTSQELKLAILKLINALIEMYQSVEGRIGMRLEFISLGLEEALIKSSEESQLEIREEIQRYDKLRTLDMENYKKLHANLISPAWVEGKDLHLLSNALTTRWASLPNQQSVVVATLCSLLHIPNDEIVGTAKWLLLNKVVNHVVDDVQEKLILEGCDKIDLQPVLNGITAAEIHIKRELENEKLRSQQQAERIQSLEAQIHQLTENTSLAHSTEQANLKNELAETVANLSEMENKFNSETETANQLRNKLQDLQNKYEILEKQDEANLLQIKVLQQKLEEKEKFSEKRTSGEDRTSVTVTSTIPTAPSLPDTAIPSMPMTDHPSGIDLGKEELRMNRAMSKFTSNTNWVRNQPNPVFSPRLDLEGSISPNGLNSPQKAPSRTISPRGDLSPGGEIPEWKKRQMEKERLDKEKAEREQQKKLEALSSTSPETSLPAVTLSTQVSTPEVTVEIDEPMLVKPGGGELSLTEREELRLARALNRPRGQRNSQVHT